MAHPNPADDTAARIAALGPYTVNSSSLALVEGTNLFTGPVRPTKSSVPDFAVFVRTVPGPPPAPYLNNQVDLVTWVVEAVVRSNPGDYSGGEELALRLAEALHRSPPAGYVGALSRQAGPVYIRDDEQRRHYFSLPIELWWQG